MIMGVLKVFFVELKILFGIMIYGVYERLVYVVYYYNYLMGNNNKIMFYVNCS